ncbi:hypothetical protein, partial [Escherichia coli]|uniref:hypothetical protein n=1 Tax=Escherichia coli TaxID=562 RepID=UPI001BC86955
FKTRTKKTTKKNPNPPAIKIKNSPPPNARRVKRKKKTSKNLKTEELFRGQESPFIKHRF